MPRKSCPRCDSPNYKRNGHTHNQKQNHRCNCCGRQFVLDPQWSSISDKQKTYIKRMLLERVSLRGICRILKISIQWLLQFMFYFYEQLPDDLNLNMQLFKKHPDIEIFTFQAQADEMWSFVGKRANKQWIWLALDAHSRQIVAFHIGDRSEDSARALWNKIPPIYKNQAIFYTDYWDAYSKVIPYNQHRVVDKQSGRTAYIERFNCTLRQRNSRLVRKSLSFSKKQKNHENSIKFFICHYNQALLV